jgi:RNA polymerase sigma-70 factor (ECF subfamily)
MLTHVRRAAPPSTTGPDAFDDKPEGSSGTLDELLDRYAHGADALFDELYRRGAPAVRGFLTRLCADGDLADDLTQETFLRIHRARQSFVSGSPAMPWMFAIARNAFRDQLRRETVRRDHGAELSRGREARGLAPSETRGDHVLLARELADLVGATLAAIPLEHREAFILIRFEGLTVSEAAEVLGASESAVKTRAFRAYRALRAALARAGMDLLTGRSDEGHKK